MNQNPKTDLTTLTHPLMLLSIFVLLINDHILKIYFPSALTGKLSDFAGLFFFPILLSAILHFVLKPFQFQSLNIASSSFGFTTIFFSLIKTVPFFNDFIEELFSIQIILDPSDLIALIMLPLAWKLREKAESKSKTGISKLSYIVLGIASLATIATSPPLIPTIYNLTVYENTIYAEFNYKYDSGESYYFYSVDGGKTWQEVDFELPSKVAEQTGKYPELPFTLCLPENQNICYQTGTELILESQDGGKTWNTSWEFPLGRKEFFERVSSYNYFDPYDIAYIELETKQIVIAAMGSEGVLIKVDNNDWESIKVDTAGPIYFGAKDFAEANNILTGEIFITLAFAFFFVFINTITNIKNRKLKVYYLLILSALSSFISPFILLALSFISINLLINLPYTVFEIFQIIFLITFVISILLVILLTFQQLIANTNKQAKINLILISFVTLLSYSLFILWAYGIIPVYKAALWIAIGLNVLLLLWILFFSIKEFIHAQSSR